MKLPLLALLVLTTAAFAVDGNRLTYLDDDSPFWPTSQSPRFTTPQWIGDPGVDAVVILAIDDMRNAPNTPEGNPAPQNTKPSCARSSTGSRRSTPPTAAMAARH